jgi:outer membrane protein TolC
MAAPRFADAQALRAGNGDATISVRGSIGTAMKRHGKPRVRSRRLLSLGLFISLCGCASYRALPLADHPDLAASLPHVVIRPAALRLPGVTQYPFDPARGLDINEVAILAVLENPDLRAYRTRAGVAGAQLFSAGLLPDPSFTLTTAVPTMGPPPLSTAITGAIAYTLTPLFTRGAALAAAAEHLRSVDLDVLWQEWQVAQQAQLLFVQLWYSERERGLLRRYRELYAEDYRRAQRALREGNTTLIVAGTALAGLLDADTRLNTLDQTLNKVEHQLRAELGVVPTLALPLESSPNAVEVPVPTDAEIRAAMAVLPKRRPDLLALQAGYRSQEARLREAIIAQFPALDIGLNHGRDVSSTYSWGGDITIGVPIFNRNRGAIAIARATRAQLRAEYQARLDTDYGTADQLRTQAHVIIAALRRVRADLPRMERTAAAAASAYASHNLPAATYLQLETAALNKQIEALTLQRSLAETAIALDTILGEPIRAEAAGPR